MCIGDKPSPHASGLKKSIEDFLKTLLSRGLHKCVLLQVSECVIKLYKSLIYFLSPDEAGWIGPRNTFATFSPWFEL